MASGKAPGSHRSEDGRTMKAFPASGPAPASERPLERLKRFWGRDRSLSVFSVLVLLHTVITISSVEESPLGLVFADIIFPMLLISGVMAIAEKRLITTAIALLAAVTAASQIVVVLVPGGIGSTLNAGASFLSLSSMAAVMLAHVFRAGPVTAHRVQGAVGAYLLLGLACAEAYLLIEILSPGSFSFASSRHGHPLLSDFTYLSFTTLTTLGYGDSTAVNTFARAICVSEALVGQLYPAILIARLVSLQLQPHPVAPEVQPKGEPQ